MKLSRRSFLVLAVASGTGLPGLSDCSEPGPLLAAGISDAEGSAGALLRSEIELPRPYTRRLVIPPVIRPARRDATTDYYEIVQRPGRAEILPGRGTLVWGYNGIFPGPTLVSQRGRRTVVSHTNELDVPVVVHLHGGRTPPEHDGYPTDIVPPRASGGRRDYVYPMDQPAGTLWYHDHRMDFTGPQVYRGLAGFHLVTDDEERALGLPSGERDVPLMIADRAFDAAGELAYPSLDPTLERPGVRPEFASGVLGDCILVNGVPWPFLDVAATTYRLRLLNASNARRYRLVLDPAPPGGPAFVQVGADANLLAAPVEREEIPISQGERFDVVVDFGRLAVGESVTLRNTLGSGGTGDVMRFRVTRPGPPAAAIPDRLVEVPPIRADQVVATRQFWFSRGGTHHDGMAMWTVNGNPFTVDTIAARPRLGTVERWIIHSLNVPHPFHIHLAQARVVRVEGDRSSPSAVDGLKDTVNLDNGGSAELLVRFDGYRGKYVFHCHNLEHEDMQMMANFDVV